MPQDQVVNQLPTFDCIIAIKLAWNVLRKHGCRAY